MQFLLVRAGLLGKWLHGDDGIREFPAAVDSEKTGGEEGRRLKVQSGAFC